MEKSQATIDMNAVHGQSFFAMSGVEKLAFFGKVCVFLATGGFAFPNIFVE